MSEQAVYPLLLALGTAAVSGIVGSFALMKRMTLAGDAVSHLALPGLGLAFLWRIQPLVGAAATLAIGIILIDRLQRRSGLATETSIGVVFTAGLALGTLLTPREDLIDALFGGFTPLALPGFLLGIAGCAAVTIAVFAMRERLILIIFSPDIARSVGISVERVNFLFLAAFGLTILLGLQYLGALLVGAIIIVPAAAGRRLARRLNSFVLISVTAAMLSVVIGFAIAMRWHFEQGPAIAAAAAAIFGLSLVKK